MLFNRVMEGGTVLWGNLRGGFRHLVEGARPAPLGHLFVGAELAKLQTTWDALPHPDERIFVDEGGRSMDLDLYDAATWETLGLAPGVPEVARRLEVARRVHSELDRVPDHQDTWVIGARHLPTLTRCPVIDGRARLPPCEPRRDDPRAGFLYEPGDARARRLGRRRRRICRGRRLPRRGNVGAGACILC